MRGLVFLGAGSYLTNLDCFRNYPSLSQNIKMKKIKRNVIFSINLMHPIHLRVCLRQTALFEKRVSDFWKTIHVSAANIEHCSLDISAYGHMIVSCESDNLF